MKLILVRHGKPETQAGATPANPPLSALGREQAGHVGQYLAETAVDAIFHSGMARAAGTAQPLADRFAIVPEAIANLGEVDRYGVDYAYAEIIRARGEAEWRRFLGDPIGYFGIDPKRFRSETLDAYADLLARRHLETVAIFTHGFPINILLGQALGLDGMGHFLPDYGSITRLAGSSLDRLAVVSVNETAHLSGRFSGASA